MTARLFDVEDYPEAPLIRPPRRRKGAQIEDERLGHDYPPEWGCCQTCGGDGVELADSDVFVERGTPSIAMSAGQGGAWARVTHKRSGLVAEYDGHESGLRNVNEAMAILRLKLRVAGYACPDCLGMGSVKARVRLEHGHRCARCGHPYVPKGDAKMLGVEPTPHRWSPCDEHCTHGGPVRLAGVYELAEPMTSVRELVEAGDLVEAEWRILTVHHLDGDKANLRWWNLVPLCQRDHLYIQSKVVLERVYPHEHSEWFKPYAAGFYAWSYLGKDLTREEVMDNLDELLALELAPS